MVGECVTAVCCWKAAPGLRPPRELGGGCATRGGDPLRKRKTQLYPLVIECLAEGGYYAECPVLPGCHVESHLLPLTLPCLASSQ